MGALFWTTATWTVRAAVWRDSLVQRGAVLAGVVFWLVGKKGRRFSLDACGTILMAAPSGSQYRASLMAVS
jgi:hypothetical protein